MRARTGSGHARPGKGAGRRFLLSGSLALVLAACAGAPPPPAAAVARPSWPAAPETPRFLYEAVLRDSASLEPSDAPADLRRALAGADAPRGFAKPLRVAARGGRVYVTDTEQRRVQVFDVPRRRFFAFGYRLEGRLQKPAGIAVDARSNVYVADLGARQVVVFDAWGLFQRRIGDPKLLQRPSGVAVDAQGGRVYIVDAGGVDSERHEVRVYDREGHELRVIGGRGDAPGRFNLPTDAAVAPDGTLYVLDAGNFRVQAFDRDGNWLRSFGAVGDAPGQFSRPRGIAVDAEGNVYVSDAWYGNVQVFDPGGALLLAIGRRDTRDAPGRYGLAAGVAVDDTGRLYVVDQLLHKIEVIRRLPAGAAEAG